MSQIVLFVQIRDLYGKVKGPETFRRIIEFVKKCSPIKMLPAKSFAAATAATASTAAMTATAEAAAATFCRQLRWR